MLNLPNGVRLIISMGKYRTTKGFGDLFGWARVSLNHHTNDGVDFKKSHKPGRSLARFPRGSMSAMLLTNWGKNKRPLAHYPITPLPLDISHPPKFSTITLKSLFPEILSVR